MKSVRLAMTARPARTKALPASALAKACNYTLTLWQKLIRFLEYPELELSNNLAENSMRPVAVGQKNWIHVGSAQAGPKIAAILSVVESCRRLKKQSSMKIANSFGSARRSLFDFGISMHNPLQSAPR